MRFFLKHSGILLVLMGVFLLAFPFFTRLQTNASLLTGGGLVVIGFVVYVVVNKFIQ